MEGINSECGGDKQGQCSGRAVEGGVTRHMQWVSIAAATAVGRALHQLFLTNSLSFSITATSRK